MTVGFIYRIEDLERTCYHAIVTNLAVPQTQGLDMLVPLLSKLVCFLFVGQEGVFFRVAPNKHKFSKGQSFLPRLTDIVLRKYNHSFETSEIRTNAARSPDQMHRHKLKLPIVSRLNAA